MERPEGLTLQPYKNLNMYLLDRMTQPINFPLCSMECGCTKKERKLDFNHLLCLRWCTSLMHLTRWLKDKEFTCQCKRCWRYRFSPCPERFPRGGNGYPLQYSCWEYLMDRRVWWAAVQGVRKKMDTT